MKCSGCGCIDPNPFEVDGKVMCRICYFSDHLGKLKVQILDEFVEFEKRIKALESVKPTGPPWPVHYYKDCYGGAPPATGCDCCTADQQAECERDRKTIAPVTVTEGGVDPTGKDFSEFKPYVPPPLSEPDQRLNKAIAVAERLTTENEKLKAEIATLRARWTCPPFDSRRLEPSDFNKTMHEMIEKYRKEHPTFPPQWDSNAFTTTYPIEYQKLKAENAYLTAESSFHAQHQTEAENAVKRRDAEIEKLRARVRAQTEQTAITASEVAKSIAEHLEHLDIDIGDQLGKHTIEQIVLGIVADKTFEIDDLKAKLDAAPKCPNWGNCTDEGFRFVHAVVLSEGAHEKLKAAAKRHTIEYWTEDMRYVMRCDGETLFTSSLGWFHALGGVINAHKDALNLDIVHLPAAPAEETKP